MTTTTPTSRQDDRFPLIPRMTALAMLREVYASLPGVACKGLCHDSCTIVAASQLERDVLAEHGIALSDKSPRMVIEQARANPDGKIGETCAALNVFGRCAVYQDRPFICRAFGVVSHPEVTGPERFEQAMMCEHGCEPEATISVEDFMDTFTRIEALSRAVTGIARQPIPGDSPRLTGMFRREHLAIRPGFEVGPDINRHISEPVPVAGARPVKRRKGKRKKGRPR